MVVITTRADKRKEQTMIEEQHQVIPDADLVAQGQQKI